MAKPKSLLLLLLILVVAGFAFSAYQTVTLLDTQQKLSEANTRIQNLNREIANFTISLLDTQNKLSQANERIRNLSQTITELTAPQPKISLTDIATSQGCGIFSSTQTLVVQFDLVNTGNADGFAIVQMIVDGNPATENNFFVQAGRTVSKTISVEVNDCNTHDISAKVKTVTTG